MPENPYFRLLQNRNPKASASIKDNPKLKLIQSDLNKKQEEQKTGIAHLDEIIANPKIKNVNIKQADGTIKSQTKEEYVNDQLKLMSGKVDIAGNDTKPYYSGGSFDRSTGEKIAPEIKYLDTSKDGFFKKVGKGVHNVGAAVFNTFSSAATGIVNRTGDLFDTLDSEGRKLTTYEKAPGFSKYNTDGSLNPEFDKQIKAQEEFFAKTKGEVTGKHRAAATLGAVNAAGRAYFAQYEAAIQAAKKSELPVIKQFGELSDWVFGNIGEAGAYVSGKTIDALPVSEDTKAIFREPFVEFGSTLFTLGTLKVAHVAGEKGGGKLTQKLPPKAQTAVNLFVKGTAGVVANPWLPLLPLKEAIQGKIKQRFSEKIPVTEAEAKKIVNEAVKENPIEVPAKMEVKTQTGEVIPVQTNQGMVLRNLIKGQEDLSYRTLKGKNPLGVDLNTGEPIVARFTWDYKRKQGIIEVTKDTTAAEIAHEFGHFVDRKLTDKIGQKFSDLVPEYKNNKAAKTDVDSALASFVVEKLSATGGKATQKDIAAGISELVTKIPRQVEKLAAKAGESRSDFAEKFATALSEVMTNYEASVKIAPEFTEFAMKNLQGFGFMRDKITEIAKAGDSSLKIKEEQSFENKVTKIDDKTETAIVERVKRKPESVEKALKDLRIEIKKNETKRKLEVKKGKVKEALGKLREELKKQSVKTKPKSKESQNATRSVEVNVETRFAKTINPELKANPKTSLKSKGINLEKINAPDDVVAVIDRISKANNEFRKERGRKTTLQEMKEHSMKFYGDENAYKGLNKDIIENRDRMLAAEQTMVDLAQDAASYLRKIDTGIMKPEQQQVFMEKMMRLQGVQKAFSGARSEAARLLGSLRREISPGENALMGELMKAMKESGLDQKMDITEFFKRKKEILEPTVGDKAWHIWYANILSGPSTQVRNFVGNLANLVSETVVAGATNPKQLPSTLSGLYDGLINKGVSEAKTIFKEGQVSKFEDARKQPVFEGKLKFLNYMSYVGRSMSAVDAFFREGFRGMEAKGLAFEKATKEGLKGKELESRVNELYNQQIEARDAIVRDGMSMEAVAQKYGSEMVELVKTADEFALRGTYNNKPTGFMGTLSNALSAITTPNSKDSIGKKISKGAARTIVPFTRVVANVVNVGLDWTPLGYTREGLYKLPYEIYKNGKIPEMTRRQHQELGRATLGTIATFSLGLLASGGYISGNGPTNSKEKSQLMASGWRPNSIKIGDTWVPYSNLGPVALPLAWVSNYFDAVRYGDVKEEDTLSRLSVMALGSVKTITDMSFLSGVSDLLEAVNDPKGYGSSYIKNYTTNIVTAPVPAAYNQIRKYFDPTVYETPTIKAAILADLGITSGLKPRLNVFGQEIKSDYISKLQPIPETNDETIKHLTENNLWISIPSKATQIKVNGEQRPMTADEYYLYVEESGKAIKKELDAKLAKIKSIQDLEKKDKYINEIVQKEREKIKKKIQKGELK